MTLIGAGELLHAGNRKGLVRYRLSVSEASPHRMGEIEGRISGDIDWLALVGEDLVLELEDGQRWDCILANSGGRLVNRGQSGLYRNS